MVIEELEGPRDEDDTAGLEVVSVITVTVDVVEVVGGEDIGHLTNEVGGVEEGESIEVEDAETGEDRSEEVPAAEKTSGFKKVLWH